MNEDIGDGDGNNDLSDDTDGIEITVGLGEEFTDIWDEEVTEIGGEEATEIGGEEATEIGGEEATEIGGVGIWLIGLCKVFNIGSLIPDKISENPKWYSGIGSATDVNDGNDGNAENKSGTIFCICSLIYFDIFLLRSIVWIAFSFIVLSTVL